MTRTQGRIIAFVLAAATLVVTQVAKDASLFGLSPAVAQLLVIVNGILALATNYLPSIFKAEPTPLPGNPTGTDNP